MDIDSERMQRMGYVIIDLEFNNIQNITKFYPNIYNEQKDLKELDSYN